MINMKPNKIQDVMRFVAVAGPSECWLWTGGAFSGRYGRFSLGGKALLAHRVVYELHHGPVPEGLYVMHKCNNKLCCNPKHLTPGSGSRNQHHASTSGAFKLGAQGIRGISFDHKRGYWKANGYHKGKLYNLYTGPHLEKALASRQKWDAEHDVTFDLTEGEDRENFQKSRGAR